eukprot:TRINITY_DN2270_c0_g1_i1.p1 TRINITY_DN2270_c0_g1~~TRINITY_DN2270_c0_g1_i1.p1  ORF type:complete len:587 (-),score=81.27 TRINITY_DN2270_c0_g1_i1:285-1889(-)
MPSCGYYIIDTIGGKVYKRFQESPQLLEIRERKVGLEERRNKLSNQIKAMERKLRSINNPEDKAELCRELTLQRSILSLCQGELDGVVMELQVLEKKKSYYLEHRRNLDRMHSSYWGSFPFLENQLQFLNLLGYGGQAEVWECYDMSRGEKVAVKVNLNGSMTKAIAEANLLKGLDHPGLTKCYGHKVIDDTVFTILESFPGISLHCLSKRDRTIFVESSVRVIAKQLCDIIDYLHARDIVHMDITPSNIIVDLATLRVKLIDFGSFEFLSTKNKAPAAQKSGTLKYLPAECLNPNKAPLISHAIDVYQLGNIIFELSFGVSAFWEEGNRLPDHSKPLQWPTKPVSLEAKDFMSSCLSSHDYRPTIRELKPHRFLDLSLTFETSKETPTTSLSTKMTLLEDEPSKKASQGESNSFSNITVSTTPLPNKSLPSLSCMADDVSLSMTPAATLDPDSVSSLGSTSFSSTSFSLTSFGSNSFGSNSFGSNYFGLTSPNTSKASGSVNNGAFSGLPSSGTELTKTPCLATFLSEQDMLF